MSCCRHAYDVFLASNDLLDINPFVLNALFLYLLKTPESRKVFYCFQGVEKGCTGNKWVKALKSITGHNKCLAFEHDTSQITGDSKYY